MDVNNSGATLVSITSITANWIDTPTSQSLKEVKFGGTTIVSPNDPQPPSNFPAERPWTGLPSDRELGPSSSKLLELLFQHNLLASGYSVTINFDNGCSVSASQ